jgi:NifU-like protein involved in Fe-S cluster formation|tara:strand:+ start:267 stop:671 length:405 start_codon:yes stop_codon:yes gene_type:complete
MIDSKIIKIASYTENVGLRNKFTHKSSIKNSLCGDFIKTEFIADKLKVKSMRYETESCLLCEASASLFSRKIKNFKIRELIKEIKELKKSNNNINYSFSNKLKEFDRLINKKNINRFNCVTLPMEAFLKAFKMK